MKTRVAPGGRRLCRSGQVLQSGQEVKEVGYARKYRTICYGIEDGFEG